MLELTHLTKSYGQRKILDSVSLSLETRQTHVLLGSSGSGKSTLLRAILGLVEIDSGTIRLDGTSILGMSAKDRAKKIGYIPQDANLFPHLTAIQNITLVAKSYGWQKAQIRSRVQELNQMVVLDEQLFRRYPAQLSGGQKQRIALLRALFLDPDFVLMDEPFASLDPLVRAEIQSEVKTLFQKLGKTVIFVTHDVGEAHYLAQDIVLLHEGRVVQEGALQDLINNPACDFVSKFLNAQRIPDLSGGG